MNTYRLAATSLAGLLSLALIGCGGRVDDPTSVALKRNKEEPKAGGGGTAAPVKSGTPSNGGTPTEPAKEGYGSIKGRIVLAAGDAIPGTKYIAEVGKASTEPGVCAKDNPIIDESLLVDKTRGVKNVFIYLRDMPTGGKEAIASQSQWPTEEKREDGVLVMDQINCTFRPHAMIVPLGKPLIAKSGDPVTHTISGTSRGGAITASIATGSKDGVDLSPSYKLPEFTPVMLKCNTHGWMRAYHLPLKHPYAAITKEDGSFEISDLPSGEHEFIVWHENGEKLGTLEVTVTANDTNDLGEISYSLSDLK